MKQADFNELLDKVRNGTATDEEKLFLDRWFDTIDFGPGEVEWTEHERASQMAQIWNAIATRQPEVRSMSFARNRWIKIAASISIAILCSYVLFEFVRQDQTITIATSKEERTKAVLPDGTIVWIKENSTFTFPKSFPGDERVVYLTGQAFFEVSKQADRPFIIRSGDLAATVLGTSFNMTADGHTIGISVLTGRVELFSALSGLRLLVQSNEQLVFDGSTPQSRSNVSDDQRRVLIEGTEYAMSFQNASMNEIAKRIQGKFGVEINGLDQKISDCLITGDFTDQSLEATLRRIAHILGFQYHIDGKTVVITGGGCS